MRILVIGQAAFGQEVFNRLRDAGEEVVAVAAPAQSLSGRTDRLRAAADAAGVPAVETASLRDPAVQARLREAAPDLGVMVYVSDLIPVDVLNLPKHGTIQYHPSLLPKHRGRSSINWAIIKGETTTGVTIFWPDAGWDTGPILLQREVEIGPDDTAGSLYYDKLYPMGIEMILEAVKLVAAGRAPRIPQDESQATYEKPAEDPLVRIDWRDPARDVYNLIRGCDPSPGAWTRFEGAKVRLTDARLQPGEAAPPGVVAAVSEEGILVGGRGGSILARKLSPASGPAVPAREFALAHGITPGARFLNPKRS
ncbi:MAG TPA: methionyl-tRNA formyltransferase [Dehalococcoidia bacterium]|nr:methionyl-tRNA formyltransferase [Dehalococcoidia bacterium]